MPRTTSVARKIKHVHYNISCTPEEVEAWQNRPLACSNLQDAVRIYRTKQSTEELQLTSWPSVFKQKRAHSEWCYRHEHPLKTGRKGVLYNRYDYLNPIIDSMRDMHECASGDIFGLFITNKRKRAKREDVVFFNNGGHVSSKEPGSVAPVVSNAVAHVFTCRGCESHNIGDLVLDHEGYTCSQCGVWAGVKIVAGNRQRLGALEEDDKTITSDRPWEANKDRYDKGPETAAEARASRNSRGKAAGLGGKRAGQHMGRLCDVQTMMEREAAKSIVEAEVAAGIALLPRDRVKQRSVLTHVEELFKILHPIEHEVKRAVRISADSTYILAVQHARYCRRRDFCEVRLAERNASAIAQAIFEYTIERLCKDKDENHRVAFEIKRLRDLRERMSRSLSFTSRTSATQIASSKMMVEMLNSQDFDFKKPCEKCETLSDDRGSIFEDKCLPSKSSTSLCMPRSISLCSNGQTSPFPSKQIALRNAIGTLFIAHRTELTVAVRDAALRAIQTDAFTKACKSEQVILSLKDNQLAFCLLNAVAMEQATTSASSFSNPVRLNAGIADKVRAHTPQSNTSKHSSRYLRLLLFFSD